MSLLRPHQRQSLQLDIDANNAMLNDPNTRAILSDTAAMRKQTRLMEKQLADLSPKPYETAQEKDDMLKKEIQLRSEWTEGMLSVEEMRRNQAGATNRHIRWQQANKQKILDWKEVRLRLDPNSDDPDLANIEMYRPERALAYTSEAQIPGHHAMSPLAKLNWPEEMADPKAKTAISHLQKGK